MPQLLQKLAMPLQPHRRALFCPLSPEAYLLTGTFFIYYVMGNLFQHLTEQVGYLISRRLSKWGVETTST
jgi:hypothetical protein